MGWRISITTLYASSGGNVFITAEHCLFNIDGPWFHKSWESRDSNTFGNSIGSRIFAKDNHPDIGYIDLGGNVQPTYNIQNSDDTEFPLLKITGWGIAGVGAFICRSSFTHIACGRILLTGQTVKIEETAGIVFNLDVISFSDTAPQMGDVGGAYFAFDNSHTDVDAVGIHVGSGCLQYPGYPPCTSTNVAFMEPIDRTLFSYDCGS
ncbi:hypothetical protein Glove_374g37 [Diversispora epigaea]|uniref:Peptidase S1 domain-containing protein n=1 Tax=Diversispora epigaea TaxID=1348612 RepID=A0A397HD84_9GLOM|nr:hypothetical protein Glove_374g37 [Diversispora epigaea]